VIFSVLCDEGGPVQFDAKRLFLKAEEEEVESLAMSIRDVW